MYPELITRPDIKVFLPPIGNLTVYICTISLSSFRGRLTIFCSREPRLPCRRDQSADPKSS
jgi:hypothetical protein